MASNTSSYAANIAVRAFLTQIGGRYLTECSPDYKDGEIFNSRSRKGKEEWRRIKEYVFNNECAYCGKREAKLTMEHLIMANRTQVRLHHPGNVVPSCASCNQRGKRAIKKVRMTVTLVGKNN